MGPGKFSCGIFFLLILNVTINEKVNACLNACVNEVPHEEGWWPSINTENMCQTFV